MTAISLIESLWLNTPEENQKYLRVPFFLGWPSANTEKSMKRETGSIGRSSPISFAGSKTSNLRIS